MIIQQQILGLQVAVRNTVAVAVLYAGDNLLKEAARIIVGQPASLDDKVKQLAAARVLRHDEHIARRLDHLVQADDVGMHAHLEDLDLALELLLHLLGADLLAVQDLDRDHLACRLVLRQLHLPERADAERLAQDVVADAKEGGHACARRCLR